MRKYLRISKKSSTFAPAFQKWGPRHKPNEVFVVGRAEAPYLQIVPEAKKSSHRFSAAVLILRSCCRTRGELSEWSKEPHSKCGIRITSYRGFESLTLRRVNEKDVHKRASFFIYLEMRAFSHPFSEGSYLALLERTILKILQKINFLR